MNESKYKDSKVIVTNEDKLKLALKDYKSKRDYGKDLFSSLFAFISLILTILSSEFTNLFGIRQNTLEVIFWFIVSALGFYIMYNFYSLIRIIIRKNYTLEWFEAVLLGEEDKYRIDYKVIFTAVIESIITIFYWLWKSIGYVFLILFYILPFALLILIGFLVGWKEIFTFYNGNSYAYPYIIFGLIGTSGCYVLISNLYDLGIHEAVRDFFETIFDIYSPY